jgi:ribonuclease PH
MHHVVDDICIRVYVIGVLAAAITCVSLAIANANIALYDLVAACSAVCIILYLARV